jgi:hypothetical protein
VTPSLCSHDAYADPHMRPRSALPLPWCALGALLSLSACGGAPPAAPALAPAPTVAPPPAPPPDVTAVPAPAGLIGYARVSKPSQFMKIALGWAHLPALRPADLDSALAGENVGDIVDLDQPIDVALVNGGTGLVPAWAVSAGVRSLEAARSALPERLTLTPGENGAFWIRPAGAGDGAKKGTTERPCEIVPAAGPTPFRLVCGASEEALGYLGPYLTRTSPRQTFESDMHLELYSEPLKPFAKMMRGQAPALLESMLELRRTQAPALADLVEAVVGDLVDLVGDLGKTQVDVHVDPEGLNATLHVGFTSKTSLLARISTAHPERADAALPSFWRLPDDSDSAFFSRGYDSKDLEHARDLSIAALEGLLGKEGLPEADQKAIGAAFHDVLTDAAVVYARGSDVVAVQKALVAFQTAKEGTAKEQAARAAVEPYLGWWVFGLDEPPTRLQGLVKAMVAAWNRPGIAKWLKTHVEGVPAPALRSLPASGLPKDAAHLELSVFIRPDEATPVPGPVKVKPTPPTPIKLHMLVVPDAGRTWLVLAADEKMAVAKAKGLLASGATGAPGTLASNPRLESLREGRETGGGFTTLRAWVALSPEPNLEVPHGKASDPLGLLASLPAQGLTPIVFTVGSSPAGADDTAGALAGKLSIPRAAIEDIILFAVKSEGKL